MVWGVAAVAVLYVVAATIAVFEVAAYFHFAAATAIGVAGDGGNYNNDSIVSLIKGENYAFDFYLNKNGERTQIKQFIETLSSNPELLDLSQEQKDFINNLLQD